MSQKKTLIVSFCVLICLNSFMFAMAREPGMVKNKIKVYYATIHIYTDLQSNEDASKAKPNVEKAVQYLESKIGYVNYYERIKFKVVDHGRTWDTSDVPTRRTAIGMPYHKRTDKWDMIHDLTGDMYRAGLDHGTKDGSVVIGFTTGLYKCNGIANTDSTPYGCLVSYKPSGKYIDFGIQIDWPNHRDDILTLHELAHELGQLREGDNGHVDEDMSIDGVFHACSMDYSDLANQYYGLCSSCRNAIVEQAVNNCYY